MEHPHIAVRDRSVTGCRHAHVNQDTLGCRPPLRAVLRWIVREARDSVGETVPTAGPFSPPTRERTRQTRHPLDRAQ
jgi:hypothetical protein